MTETEIFCVWTSSLNRRGLTPLPPQGLHWCPFAVNWKRINNRGTCCCCLVSLKWRGMIYWGINKRFTTSHYDEWADHRQSHYVTPHKQFTPAREDPSGIYEICAPFSTSFLFELRGGSLGLQISQLPWERVPFSACSPRVTFSLYVCCRCEDLYVLYYNVQHMLKYYMVAPLVRILTME